MSELVRVLSINVSTGLLGTVKSWNSIYSPPVSAIIYGMCCTYSIVKVHACECGGNYRELRIWRLTVCVYVCMRACVCVCVHVCVRACVCARAHLSVQPSEICVVSFPDYCAKGGVRSLVENIQ